MIKLENIQKIYNKGTISESEIFHDFNFHIKEKEFVTVIGSNGSGKSTLLNLIGGNLPLTSGKIYLDNKDITNLKEYKRAVYLGRVFQDPALGTCPNMTVIENMALADNKNSSFGLQLGVSKSRIGFYKEKLSELSLGLEDKTEMKVKLLSGGQRQALSLLMCTLTNIKCLILDEHTAALDPNTSENIIELTNKIVNSKSITTIMVTHNLKYAIKYGNRLIMMHKGHIIMDLSKEEKENVVVDDLLSEFFKISIEVGNSI